MQTLSEEALQSQAIAILKAKNRLSADDAKLVEEAFAARVALPDASHETPPAPATQTDSNTPQPPAPFVGAVKRPRGRPRKIRTAVSHPPERPVTSPPTLNGDASASMHQQADVVPAKIDSKPPSASHVDCVIKPISNSWHRNRVWSAEEVPPTPTTFDSSNRGRWD
jgi:hypothetical protein